jgi:RsmE family RNA methyltransferase
MRANYKLQRLYLDACLAAGDVVPLGKEQAHYLLTVLRLGDGAEVLVFNGRDGEFGATLQPEGKKSANLKIGVRTREQPERSRLDFLFAPLKVGRLEYLVQKATEMGVNRITPVFTDHTQLHKVNSGRLAANILEAAEQCGNLAVPELGEALKLETLLSDAGCKPPEDWRIGTEHEKFGYCRDTLKPLPYEGERSVRAMLEGLQDRFGWAPIREGENIIGLEKDGANISLEPGGQFELSGAPLESIHQTCRESNAHLAQLRQIADPLGIKFLGLGASPKWTLAETPRMPKSRYDIMRAYMPKVGSEGLDMMHRTSTIQVNLDFSSEADMRKKMQVSYRLQPVATALFANSPFTDGKPNGLLSWRADIWRDTDNDRAGVLPFVFADDFGFMDYTQWVLDVPMYFVLRDGKYRDCTHVTFRQFMDGALEGEIPDAKPNMGDWTNHLSTLCSRKCG